MPTIVNPPLNCADPLCSVDPVVEIDPVTVRPFDILNEPVNLTVEPDKFIELVPIESTPVHIVKLFALPPDRFLIGPGVLTWIMLVTG